MSGIARRLDLILAASILFVLCGSRESVLAEVPGGNVSESVAGSMVFDFGRAEGAWRNIDDVVMGGLSSSRMEVEQGRAVFAGELSLENNGGFASVRSEPLVANLKGATGLALRLRGDGRTYQLRIRTNSAFDGPSYQVAVTPPREVWTVTEVPFSDFRPTFRGRELGGFPPLLADEIKTIGFLISDKQEGPFQLEVEWVKVF